MEKLSREYTMVQEQLQSLAMQKEQFSERKEEYKEALKEVEAASGKIYLAVGGAIVEVGKEHAIKNIKEKQEVSDMRLGMIKKQNDDLVKKEQELRTEINSAIKSMKG